MRIVMEEKEETRVQMAPMIDMVFLLIIFFMTSRSRTAGWCRKTGPTAGP